MQDKENEIVYLYLDDIIPNRFQPRQVFDEKALKELAVSIKEHGVIQPIIVRNIGNKYEIIAGERRYKASALAGLTKIPAIVRNLDDKESSKVALLENLQRKNLNPIEEARTYQKILELDQMTQEELAKTMGKSQSAVANKLRLLSLSDDVQNALLKEQISERHARSLLSLTNAEDQKSMVKKVIDNKMTVRELEEEIKKLINPSENTNNLSDNNNVSFDSTLSQPVFTPPVVPDIPMQDNPNSDFNQSIGIDYSTPPKFIDYGTNNRINGGINNSSFDDTQINLDEVRKNATDINVEKPKADLDSLLRVDSNQNKQIKEEENIPTGNFKFFAPTDIPNEKKEESKTQDSSIDIFSSPTTSDSSNLLSQGEFSKEPSGIDSLLKADPIHLGEEKPQEEEKIPYLDTYNNPFAHNPIFQDDVKKIMGIEETKEQKVQKYDFNDCLTLVRNAIHDIESSGFKVDSEEMNFEKNYQIVIKIAKKEEDQK